jgi:hypothetical protein
MKNTRCGYECPSQLAYTNNYKIIEFQGDAKYALGNSHHE